jgi:hypothetical protein
MPDLRQRQSRLELFTPAAAWPDPELNYFLNARAAFSLHSLGPARLTVGKRAGDL